MTQTFYTQAIVVTKSFVRFCFFIAFLFLSTSSFTQDVSFNEALPLDLTIDCDALVPLPATLTATDNCTGTPMAAAVTFIDSTVIAATCDQESTITRTWSAMDACGNGEMIEHIQTITIIDTIAPILNIPASVIQACNVPAVVDITIDFQNLETNASGTFVNVGNPVIQNGYQFLQTSDGTTPIAEFQVTPISSANFPGSTTLISPLANQIVVLTPLNGTPFTITSVDLALIAGPFTNVVFTGTTASGATVTQTFNITPGPLSTFNFNASFTDLVSLTYTGVGLSPACLLYTSPSPRDRQKSRMPSSA